MDLIYIIISPIKTVYNNIIYLNVLIMHVPLLHNTILIIKDKKKKYNYLAGNLWSISFKKNKLSLFVFLVKNKAFLNVYLKRIYVSISIKRLYGYI